MNINKLSENIVEANPHKVAVHKMYDKESAQAMHITLQPDRKSVV